MILLELFPFIFQRLAQLHNMKDKAEPQFDFEINNFPPLPGPGTTVST
jgi:hypothetical protein